MPVLFNMVKESLLASGVTDAQEVNLYRQRLDDLYRQFKHQTFISKDNLEIFERLFEWLWRGRTNRYQPGGAFQLHKVINAQFNPANQPVGNCLGLTLLYNCLLKKAGISVCAMYLKNAFNRGPHILSVVNIKQQSIDVEHAFSNGFGYQGHLKSSKRTLWGDRELVADIYNSRGNVLFEKGVFHEALDCYEKAVVLNPKYEPAFLNRAIVLQKLS